MKRLAPDPEFVMMYRKGIPSSKSAALEDVAETTVRYHLQIAARAEPGIRDEHKAALPLAARRMPEAGLRNLADVIAFHESEGRLPVTHGKSAKERALGAWLARRRREATEAPSPPSTVKPWRSSPDGTSPQHEKPMTRPDGSSGLEELQKLRAAGGDWPRHQKTDDKHERTLGVWLHGQRIDYRAGRLDPVKEKKLNKALPGWRDGRGHRGGHHPKSKTLQPEF